jgi:hypothetical protein
MACASTGEFTCNGGGSKWREKVRRSVGYNADHCQACQACQSESGQCSKTTSAWFHNSSEKLLIQGLVDDFAAGRATGAAFLGVLAAVAAFAVLPAVATGRDVTGRDVTGRDAARGVGCAARLIIARTVS